MDVSFSRVVAISFSFNSVISCEDWTTSKENQFDIFTIDFKLNGNNSVYTFYWNHFILFTSKYEKFINIQTRGRKKQENNKTFYSFISFPST